MATRSSILAWRVSMDRGAWWVTAHGVTKSQTRLSTWCQVNEKEKQLLCVSPLLETDVWVFHTSSSSPRFYLVLFGLCLPEVSIRSHKLSAQPHKTALHFRLQSKALVLSSLQTQDPEDPSNSGCQSQVQLSHALPTSWLESEVPTAPTSGWINLLQQLTAPGKTCFLTGLPVYFRRMWHWMEERHRVTHGREAGVGGGRVA